MFIKQTKCVVCSRLFSIAQDLTSVAFKHTVLIFKEGHRCLKRNFFIVNVTKYLVNFIKSHIQSLPKA